MHSSPFISLLSTLTILTQTALVLALPKNNDIGYATAELPFNLTSCPDHPSIPLNTTCGPPTSAWYAVTNETCAPSIADVPDTPADFPGAPFLRYFRAANSSCEVFYKYEGGHALTVDWPVVKTQWLPWLLEQCPGTDGARETVSVGGACGIRVKWGVRYYERPTWIFEEEGEP
ncbi:MAG: hypothetical protein Q9167_007880 [Letrouitia subvulpina]